MPIQYSDFQPQSESPLPVQPVSLSLNYSIAQSQKQNILSSGGERDLSKISIPLNIGSLVA
jgi:hypothetical protein